MFKRHLFRLFVAAVSVALGSASLHAQTDVAANLYATINKSTNGTSSYIVPGSYSPTFGVSQTTRNSVGVMLEVRHFFAPLIGIEATYSFHPANQKYGFAPTPQKYSGAVSPASFASVSARAQQFTVDWIPSMKIGKLRPFGVAGVGALWVSPSSSQVPVSNIFTPGNTSSSTSSVYVYGAGLDIATLPHLGLRLQYRGDIYKAPDLLVTTTQVDGNTNSWTHTAEPMIGVYFRL